MLRAIVLSLTLLIGIGTLIPLATEFAEAGSNKQRKYKQKKVKKYSKRWWRAYNKRKAVKRAKVRRAKKARATRARKARVRRARLARVRRAKAAKQRRSSVARKRAPRRSTRRTTPATSFTTVAKFETPKTETPTYFVPTSKTTPAVLPSGNPAPKSWKPAGITQGELQFSVTNNSGSTIGAASISVVGPAVEESPMFGGKVKTVGGVTTTALRRTVIDQMIRENGWVVNDFQKEIGGNKVYVVVAQSPGANNQVENRMFYFTEVEGKIYSVATKSPENDSERLKEESEKVLNSLQRKTTPNTQLAVNRTASNLVANEE